MASTTAIMANWRYHVVEVGGDRNNGYKGTDVTVRTNGTVYEKKELVRMKTHVPLKELLEQLVPILEQHPDADVDQEDEPYTDHDHFTTVEWWTPLSEGDPLLETIITFVKNAEATNLERDKRELERLKKERPDLF